jgi:hypothetical protein
MMQGQGSYSYQVNRQQQPTNAITLNLNTSNIAAPAEQANQFVFVLLEVAQTAIRVD